MAEPERFDPRCGAGYLGFESPKRHIIEELERFDQHHYAATKIPNRSPAKRVRFGEEEQRHERALTFYEIKKPEQAM